MKINKENALKLWDERIGKQIQSFTDFAGREVNKGLYGDTNSKKGWNIDHIMPVSNGGSSEKDNLIIVHHQTNSDKGNKITFDTNNKKFQVQEVKPKKYEIIEITKTKDNIEEQLKKLVYNQHIKNGKDFAGRIVDYKEYNTKHKNAWTISKYTSNIDLNYAAHITTVKEQNQKANFTANGYDFQLKRIENKYYFLNLSEYLGNFDFNSLIAISDNVIATDKRYEKDILTVNLKNKGLLHDNAMIFSKTVLIIKNIINSFNIDYDVVIEKSMYNNSNAAVNFIFDSNNNDTCKIQEIAIYIHTMFYYFNEKNDYRNIIDCIYHWRCILNSSDIYDMISEPSQFLKRFSKPDNRYNNKTEIYIHNDVKNILLQCNYENSSFKESRNSSWFTRSYVYTAFEETLKKYRK